MPDEPIYHITERHRWDSAGSAGEYVADSLATEGFIHCSLRRQVLLVADALYRGREDLVLLEIDAPALLHELRFEGVEDRFPHLYGPLNLDAVRRAAPFPAADDGRFAFPPEFA